MVLAPQLQDDIPLIEKGFCKTQLLVVDKSAQVKYFFFFGELLIGLFQQDCDPYRLISLLNLE
jgi:hypothetical protein